jgi:hypothetical protein
LLGFLQVYLARMDIFLSATHQTVSAVRVITSGSYQKKTKQEIVKIIALIKMGLKQKNIKKSINRAARENQSIKSLSYAYDLKEAKALGMSIEEYREMMK